MSRDLSKVLRRFSSFAVSTPDLWIKRQGVRLVLSPSGYGLREDGIGKLVQLSDADLVLGRDEKRVARIVALEAKSQFENLAREMTVRRELVVGKKRTIITEPIRKSQCYLRVENGEIKKPNFTWVRYETPAGNFRFRKVVGGVNT